MSMVMKVTVHLSTTFPAGSKGGKSAKVGFVEVVAAGECPFG